eukprot:SAG22_NODE_12780_length_429_cov_1.548485_1_plen_111_part_01
MANHVRDPRVSLPRLRKLDRNQRGEDFGPDWHLSRETIKGLLRPVEERATTRLHRGTSPRHEDQLHVGGGKGAHDSTQRRGHQARAPSSGPAAAATAAGLRHTEQYQLKLQ